MTNIIIITLNTAVDHLLSIEDFKLGDIVRATNSTLYPSGKGVNSARTLEALKEDAIVTGFVGENDSAFFKFSDSPTIKTQLIEVPGDTRRNITILNRRKELITHLQTMGYEPGKAHVLSLMNKLKKIIHTDNVVVLSGSLPKNLKDTIYSDIIKYCRKKSARLILDTSGNTLQAALVAKPFAVKPNLEELQVLLGRKIKTEKEIVLAAKDLNNKGIELALISNGAKGVILSKAGIKGYWKAHAKITTKHPAGDEIGCGDAMIGGVAAGLNRQLEVEDLLRLSVACGAANLLKPGPGYCNKKDIDQLYKKAVVQYKK